MKLAVRLERLSKSSISAFLASGYIVKVRKKTAD
jgi:hypothetical protein